MPAREHVRRFVLEIDDRVDIDRNGEPTDEPDYPDDDEYPDEEDDLHVFI